MDKESLRRKYLELRKKLNNREKKTRAILQRIVEQPEYQKAKQIALYKSLTTEVDTEELIRVSFEEGKKVLLPRIVQDEIQFFQITPNENLEKSEFGIEEPKRDNKKMVSKDKIDLMIVPGICFDEKRNRLGFGKGYYDRYLKDYHGKTIAICFEEQILKEENLPISENDIKIQKIITNERIY